MIRFRLTLALLLTSVTLGYGPPAIAAEGAPASPTRYSGTLPDGATWVADVPASWNGTILLFSHGYNPGPANPASDSSEQPSGGALLARGYALAGSSYSRVGWALATAPRDQLATLREVQRRIGRADHVIGYGQSMGGLVNGVLAQRAGARVDGALTTCGIVAGGVDLHNSQLDGLHTLNQLLLPGRPAKLVRFTSFDQAVATVDRLTAAIKRAQRTPAGRARIALAATFFHLSGWFAGLPKPATRDFAAQEVGQYNALLSGLFRYETGRFDVEQSAGGNPSWNVGVNYRKLLPRSDKVAEVRSLYRGAGLHLRADLTRMTRTAHVRPDTHAVRLLRRTSTVSGRLEMPVLTLHTTNDELVPVQHEEEYAEDVRGAGDTGLLRQAFVDHPGHCAFTVAEVVAGVETIRRRIETGHWGGSTSAQRMQTFAGSLQIGDAAFVHFRPGEFLADRRLPLRLRSVR